MMTHYLIRAWVTYVYVILISWHRVVQPQSRCTEQFKGCHLESCPSRQCNKLEDIRSTLKMCCWVPRAASPEKDFMSGRFYAEDFALLQSRWMASWVTPGAGDWESRELTPGVYQLSSLLFELHGFFVSLFCFCIMACTMQLLGFGSFLSLCQQLFQYTHTL